MSDSASTLFVRESESIRKPTSSISLSGLSDKDITITIKEDRMKVWKETMVEKFTKKKDPIITKIRICESYNKRENHFEYPGSEEHLESLEGVRRVERK